MKKTQKENNNAPIKTTAPNSLQDITDNYLKEVFSWQIRNFQAAGSAFSENHSRAIKRGLQARKERLAQEALDEQSK